MLGEQPFRARFENSDHRRRGSEENPRLLALPDALLVARFLERLGHGLSRLKDDGIVGAKGCRIFDYGRSKRGTGAFEFKTYWGFEPESLYYEYFLVKRKRLPNLSPTNPQFGRAIGLWRRMPLWLTQILGPHVAKYLS